MRNEDFMVKRIKKVLNISEQVKRGSLGEMATYLS